MLDAIDVPATDPGRLDEPETIRNERSAFMYCGVPLPIWRAPFFEIKLLENAVS